MYKTVIRELNFPTTIVATLEAEFNYEHLHDAGVFMAKKKVSDNSLNLEVVTTSNSVVLAKSTIKARIKTEVHNHRITT